MRLAIGTSLTGAGVAPSDPLIYQSRVVADGGTVEDPTHSYIVYNEVTEVETPSLLCTCDSVKATKLYNIIPE